MTNHPLRFRHPATLVWILCLLAAALSVEPGAAAPRTVDSVTTISVTTTQDRSDGNTNSLGDLAANPGSDAKISLQEAIKAANNTPAGAVLTIQFNLPAQTDVVTLTLSQPLPALARGNIRIDATTQPQNARVVMDGSTSSRGSSSLLTISSNNNELRGLTIRGFFNDAVLLQSNASGNQIIGCTLQANGHNGITFNGAGVTQNQIVSSVLANNGASGAEILGGATQNSIGGIDAASVNTIKQNAVYGVLVRGRNTHDNKILANTFVENSSVTSGSAIALFEESESTTVAQNTITSNKRYGLWLDTSDRNTIQANSIGLAADGVTPQANGNAGILVSTNANSNTIGGSAAGRNLIAGNAKEGIVLFGPENTISHNYIGIGADGQTPVGNQSYGIRVRSTASANRIEANLISANSNDGVRLESSRNVVLENQIGVSTTGAALPNHAAETAVHGITVVGTENVIGPNNLIANHAASGIYITGGKAQVLQNSIESNRRGVCIDADDAQINENMIQFNGIDGEGTECSEAGGGVLAEADRAVVQENIIQSNIGSGVLVLAGSGNRVQENSISNNTDEGITISPGANGELTPPKITEVSATAISGRSCLQCRIELFTDDGDEGRTLLGATVSDGAGLFTLAVTPQLLTRTFVTATATDSNNNTSAFASPFRIPPSISPRSGQLFIPVAVK